MVDLIVTEQEGQMNLSNLGKPLRYRANVMILMKSH